MPLPSDYRELASPSGRPPAIEAEWMFCASADGTHVVLPDGRMDLIVSFRERPDGRLDELALLVVGPAQRWTDVPVKEGDQYLGVRFRAGWGGRCLGVEPARLRDTALFGEEVASVLGTDAVALLGAPTRASLMECLRRVTHRRALAARHAYALLTRAVDCIHLGGGRLALHDVAVSLGVPERTLRRHLAREVGLSFKVFSSVLRFQRTMGLLADGSQPSSLAAAALEGGYSDQAHMTREFRRHGGFTPGARPPLVLVGTPVD